LKEQLKLLEELQRHDARLQEIESQLKALPEKLEQMRSDLAKIEKILGQERGQLTEAEKWRSEQEQQLKFEEEAIVKAKTKLQTVKTSREHMAADRELKTTREMKEEREGEILKLLAATEANQKLIAAHEAQVAELRAEVESEEVVINARIAELQQQATVVRSERDGATSEVKADVLKRYRTIRMRRGLAVVPVRDGVCAGCHMAVPPQLYNTLQRGTSIELCPQCGRIIYYDVVTDGEPQEAPPESHGETPPAAAAPEAVPTVESSAPTGPTPTAAAAPAAAPAGPDGVKAASQA
jgi:hypothetical protein